MEDGFDIIVNATRDQIENLKTSIIWSDICRELDTWTNHIKSEISTIPGLIMDGKLTSEQALTFIGYNEGRKEAVERFKNILDQLLISLEGSKDDSRHN